MRVSNEFVVREIAGEYIIVAVGKTTIDFNGIITVNDIGKFLWEQMQEEFTENELVEKLLEEYDVNRETATADVKDFVSKLVSHNIVR